MAEARRATLILLPDDITKPKSLNVHTLKVICKSIVKRWRKKIYFIKNRFYNGLYPSKPGNSKYVIGAVFTLSVFGHDPSFGIIGQIETLLQRYFELKSPRDHIVSAFCFSLGLWIALTYSRRKLLNYLFYYDGWMYENIGYKSWTTYIWIIIIKLIRSSGEPRLYSYQKSLPTLPLPGLKETLRTYLSSMKPLKGVEEFKELQNLADQFEKTYGNRIQLFLFLKYLISPNYVSDWWEQFVYLSSRAPLIVNSNYYGMDALFITHNWLQAARAANLVCGAFQVMNMIKLETFQPIMLQKIVPLCSAQYYRIFGTTRIPKYVENFKGADELIHVQESNHIVVFHKGRFFKCHLDINDKLLAPVDVEAILQSILDDTSISDSQEELIPVLTAGERNHWALTRDRFFSSGINKASLDSIESAAFILILEEIEEKFIPTDENTLNKMAHSLIHGKGYDRWYDKSFNMVVFKNGRAGFNAEHSWADAPIMGHMWEYILLEDVLSRNYGYTPDGHCRGIPKINIPKPERLKWDITSGLIEKINVSMKAVSEIINDLDVHIFVQNDYGKGFMKKCKVSPDGYIQFALQLTYFRLNKEFCQTYESSMTRLFRDGRTETVRSCSSEVCEAVKSFDDNDIPIFTKILYFRTAVDYHQKLYRDAMTGKGVDRHLFCMYVVCRFLNIKSDFLNMVMKQPWRLSTSQTPMGQNKHLDLSRYPNFIAAGGGFGPASDDGYGVSYIIAGEDRIFFHISSKYSCKETDSKRFAAALHQSFKDLKNVLSKQI